MDNYFKIIYSILFIKIFMGPLTKSLLELYTILKY